MKIKYCDVFIDRFYDDEPDVDSMTVNAYIHVTLLEAYKIMAEYMEKHPNGYADESVDAYYYENDGAEFCIYMKPN